VGNVPVALAHRPGRRFGRDVGAGVRRDAVPSAKRLVWLGGAPTGDVRQEVRRARRAARPVRRQQHLGAARERSGGPSARGGSPGHAQPDARHPARPHLPKTSRFGLERRRRQDPGAGSGGCARSPERRAGILFVRGAVRGALRGRRGEAPSLVRGRFRRAAGLGLAGVGQQPRGRRTERARRRRARGGGQH